MAFNWDAYPDAQPMPQAAPGRAPASAFDWDSFPDARAAQAPPVAAAAPAGPSRSPAGAGAPVYAKAEEFPEVEMVPAKSGKAEEFPEVEMAPAKGGAPAGPKKDTQKYGKARSALEGYGQGAWMGYLPQVQAMTAPVVDRISNVVTSPWLPYTAPAPWSQMNPGSPEYIAARDENIRRQNAMAEQNPKYYYGGQATGMIATSMLPAGQVAKGGGAFKYLAKSAVVGAAEAAAMNPGDKEGEFNPYQVSERLDNAKVGALFGVAGGAVGSGVSAVASKAKGFANAMAFKASGAMLKDYRQAASRGSIDQLGEFMLNKVLKAGDTFEDVAAKSEQIKQAAGLEIGKTYKTVIDEVSQKWNQLSAGQRAALSSTGFKPMMQKSAIMQKVEAEIGNGPNAKAAREFVSGYLDELGDKFGKKNLNIAEQNVLKGDIDSAINWGRSQPIREFPEKEKALVILRNHIRDEIEDHIEILDGIVGQTRTAELRAANKTYGAASQIEGIARDRVLRESTNRMFSLGDRVTGAAGAGVGAAGGLATGGDLDSTLKGAAAGASVAIASKMARKYGATLMARTAQRFAAADGQTAVAAANAMGMTKAGNKVNKEEAKAGRGPTAPTRNVDEWQMGGFQKLMQHDPNGPLKNSDMIDKAFSNPRVGELMQQASDLPPGSRAMQSVYDQIKKELGQ